MQVFSGTDRILIEIIATDELAAPPTLFVRDAIGGKEFSYNWRAWEMNGTTTRYFVDLSGMDEGIYTAIIGTNVSKEFAVTYNDDVLCDTVLFQYSNRDNRQRNDVVFWIDSMQHCFDFRVPGGFKDDNWGFCSPWIP